MFESRVAERACQLWWVGATICDAQMWLGMTEAVFGEFWSMTGVVICFGRSRSAKCCNFPQDESLDEVL